MRSVSVSKNQEMVFYSFSFPMCLYKVGQTGQNEGDGGGREIERAKEVE